MEPPCDKTIQQESYFGGLKFGLHEFKKLQTIS